jgi:predicted RNase H-like HicB family nuclease/DNA-binding XRE family transcriptional regulator
MVYYFKVHSEDSGFWAECLELEGCSTEGDTYEELAANAEEALNLYLEESEDSPVTHPLPHKVKADDVMEVPVNPQLALSVVLRRLRTENHFTQKEVADKLGMKNIFSYQRLERRSNPSLNTLQKLKEVFPDLSLDYVLKD